MNHLVNLSFEKFNISAFKRRIARYHMTSRAKVTAQITKGIGDYRHGCTFGLNSVQLRDVLLLEQSRFPLVNKASGHITRSTKQ